jgi:hypothetical protein
MLESVLFFADTVGFFAMKSQEAANLRSFHFALRLELTLTTEIPTFNSPLKLSKTLHIYQKNFKQATFCPPWYSISMCAIIK